MTNPVIGFVECPHCHHEATVHQEKRGKKAFYYRCYSGDVDGIAQCGTVQIREPGGQRWIKKNMRTLKPDEQDRVVKDAGIEAEIEAAEQVREVRREKAKEVGLFGAIGNFLADD